jgi:hypothetical protein
VIPEKYNVVTGSHDVFVEYVNVGTKFSFTRAVDRFAFVETGGGQVTGLCGQPL